MVARIRLVAVLCLVAAVGCTPGAPAAPNSSLQSGAVIIHASLGKYAANTQYGAVGGYSRNPLIVPVGTVIQFVNDDTFGHTASGLGTTGFPASGPPGSSLQPSTSTDLAAPGWSTGALQGGAVSQAFVASTAGTYFYGCFFHFSSQTPMRGVIVVQ